MSTFNISTKIQSSVIQGGTTSTLVVPAGHSFKGQISGYQNGGGLPLLELRQNNVSGLRLITLPMVASQQSTSPNDNSVTHNVELGEGTYFLGIVNGLNNAVAFTGTLYANTI